MPQVLGLGGTPATTTLLRYTSADADTTSCGRSSGGLYSEYLSPILVGGTDLGYIRFPNITIPSGSTITLARITWVLRWRDSYSVSYSDVTDYYDYSVEKTDSSSVPSSSSDLRSRCTTATGDNTTRIYATALNGVSDSAVAPWTDITTHIQSVISRPGWDSGNAIGVFIDPSTSTPSNHGIGAIPHSVAIGDSQRPRLEIVYY